MKASGILLSLCLTCHLVDIGEGSSLTRCQVYRLTQIYNMPGNAADCKSTQLNQPNNCIKL